MTVALTIGLLDVLVFHADAIKAQASVSAGVDLALGLLLLAAGGLLATGRLHGRPNTVTGRQRSHHISSARARTDLGVECGRLLRAERDVGRGAPGTPPHRVGSVPPVGGQHAGEHLERGRAW